MTSKKSIACAQCGKIKSLFPSHIKGLKYGTFCNLACLGKFRSDKLTGTLAANFKNGSKKDRKYQLVFSPWHPAKDKTGYVYLHRLIFEANHGDYLAPGMIVHHIDGNPENNHWDNLLAMTQAEHAREHFTDKNMIRDPLTGRRKRNLSENI